LAAGEVIEARRELAAGRAALDGQPVVAAAAQLAMGVAALLAGDNVGGATEIDRAEAAAERAAAPWLARLARAASRLACPAGGAIDATAAGAAFDPERDPWGTAMVALIEAWNPGPDPASALDGATATDRRVASAERAAAAFRRLGAGVLEAWARGLLALGLAASGAPDAREAAASADGFARAAGSPGVRLLTYMALAAADPARRTEYDELADAVRRESGLADPPSTERADQGDVPSAPVQVSTAAPSASAPPSTNGNGAGREDGSGEAAVGEPDFRTFGGFRVSLNGQPLPLERIKPRARALLRLLALHAGAAVHREVIGSALWPEADAATAARSLQVAVSAIRGLFVETLGPDGSRLIAREGDAYRLAVPADAIDVRRFERLLAEGRAARRRRESPGPALTRALTVYTGDLLPEDGPEEWVVELRERYRTLAVEAAREAAESALTEGAPRAAIESCRAGLAIDRYHDPLWRLLIESRSQAGDRSAADRDRREYESILSELGLTAESAITAS
jgi:DNA-binding SARP family transcriptional activator